MELAELKRVDRVVGIAGGQRKTAAIRGALRGRLDQRLDHRSQHGGAARQECVGGRAAGTRSGHGSGRAEGIARVIASRHARLVKALLWIAGPVGAAGDSAALDGRPLETAATATFDASTLSRLRRGHGVLRDGDAGGRRRRPRIAAAAGASPARARVREGHGDGHRGRPRLAGWRVRVQLTGAHAGDGGDSDRAGDARHGASRRLEFIRFTDFINQSSLPVSANALNDTRCAPWSEHCRPTRSGPDDHVRRRRRQNTVPRGRALEIVPVQLELVEAARK